MRTGSRSRRSQADWARLPIFLAELTGIHPTREGLTVQTVLLTVYILGRGLGLRDQAVAAPDRAGGRGMSGPIRIGVDVGGTFTKAVAIETGAVAVARAHGRPDLACGTGRRRRRRRRKRSERCSPSSARLAAASALVAFSTTQAMNALLEGDVGRVGVLGIGAAPDLRAARKRTQVGSVALAPGHALETEHAFVDATGGLDEEHVDGALDDFAAAGCIAVAISGALAVDEPEAELLAAGRAHAAGCRRASATTSRASTGSRCGRSAPR